MTRWCTWTRRAQSYGGGTGNDAVVHLSEAGAELRRIAGLNWPQSVSVNANAGDGSCWVADTYSYQVLHLDADGGVVWQGGGFFLPVSVGVSLQDGSCWVADADRCEVVHLAEDGVEVWVGKSFNQPYSVSVNPSDSSCWAADTAHAQVVHLSADGDESWRGGSYRDPWCVSANAADGSCWVAVSSDITGEVVHLSQNGTEVWRGGSISGPGAVSVNSADGSCWLADIGNSAVVHLAADGHELWRGTSFSGPASVSVNPTDGSCWVADAGSTQIVHLSEAGLELRREGGVSRPVSVSVNPSDGSCWVADTGNGEVVHLSSTGEELARASGLAAPLSVAANPADGSCWVADTGNDEVALLDADGSEVWRGWGFLGPVSLSADASDGSCWVADTSNGQVVHLVVVPEPKADFIGSPRSGLAPLAVAFTDLSTGDPTSWRWDFGDGGTSGQQNPTHEYTTPGGYTVSLTVANAAGEDTRVRVGYITVASRLIANFAGAPRSGQVPLTVDFTDESMGQPTAWLWEFGDGATSQEQNPSHQYTRAGRYAVSLTVENASGSDTVTRLRYVLVTFVDVPPDYWAFSEIMAAVDAGVVAGYVGGSYQPTLPVTRDQMAVYIARALAGGDAQVPAGPATASFPDVATGYWAFKYIEYARSWMVVEGYPDGSYQPLIALDRGQMAAFLARAIAASAGDPGLTGYLPPEVPTFPDMPTSFWAYRYVEYIAAPERAVTRGYADGKYHPEYLCTRDQIAVFVQRGFRLPM
jgi:PKD repeat protein